MSKNITKEVKSESDMTRHLTVELTITPQIRKSDINSITGVCNICGLCFSKVLTKKEKETHLNSHTDEEILNSLLNSYDYVKHTKLTTDSVCSTNKLFKKIWDNKHDNEAWDKNGEIIEENYNCSSTKAWKEEDFFDKEDPTDEELDNELHNGYRQSGR